MRVFITGGSGLIGRALAHSLHQDGHVAVILSRNADALRRDPAIWPYEVIAGDPTREGPWQAQVEGCDAVVNLAGYSIFARRWNVQVKALIRDSRVYSTQNLVAAIQRASSPPRVFIQGSAIGYYGPRGAETIDETCGSGVDFLAVVCRELEETAAVVQDMGVRLVQARTGIVLARESGALQVMMPLFRLGPGVPIGSQGGLLATGSQYMSWIHLDDEIGLIRHALSDDRARGPMNLVAPQPVTNADFTRILSGILRTRATPWRFYLPFGPPDALLRVLLGEIASFITTGQRVLPAKALELGYRFRFPDLSSALKNLLAPRPAPTASRA